MGDFLHRKIAFLKLNSLNVWIFFLSLAVIHGVSFHVMSVTDASELKDCVSYLGLAEFDFDQYEVRRYRVIVPFLASFINFILGDVFQGLAPWSFSGDFPVSMSFLVVNNVVLAFTGVLVFKYIYAHIQRFFPALFGLISLLTVAGLVLLRDFHWLTACIFLFWSWCYWV